MSDQEYVQIAGAECGQCSKSIVSMIDGVACPECSTAIHVRGECWRAHWENQHRGTSTYRSAESIPRAPEPRFAEIDRAEPGGHGGDLLCTSCHHRVWAPTKLTFTGFPRFHCPDCAAVVLHPLASGRKTFYFVAIAISVAVTIFFILQGSLAFPGVLAIWAAYALVQNRGIVSKLEHAEAAETTAAPAPVAKKKRRSREARSAA